jgi:hypothetical protein
MEALIEVMEQVGNAPFDIKSYPKYIKLCEEQDSATLGASKDNNEADSGMEMMSEVLWLLRPVVQW